MPNATIGISESRGHRSVHKIDAPEELASLVKSQVKLGDIVVCLGAGTITQWAYALPKELGGETA